MSLKRANSRSSSPKTNPKRGKGDEDDSDIVDGKHQSKKNIEGFSGVVIYCWM